MLTTARRTKIHIGPQDNGRRMSLDDFDHAIIREGYLYELGTGVIEVSNVPAIAHGRCIQELRRQLVLYQAAHPDTINYLAGGSDAKLLIAPSQSGRHPDLMLLYLSPELRVEGHLVRLGPGHRHRSRLPQLRQSRDYEEKPDEYLEFGVSGILDRRPRQIPHDRSHCRRGQWKKQNATQKYSTRLLPGFTLDVKRAIAATKTK